MCWNSVPKENEAGNKWCVQCHCGNSIWQFNVVSVFILFLFHCLFHCNCISLYSFHFLSLSCTSLSLYNCISFHSLSLLFHYLSRSALISVIVRRPNNTLVLYCKGADNVILERLKAPTTKEEEQLIANSKKHTTQFAADGLRTLMISKWCDTQWPHVGGGHNLHS